MRSLKSYAARFTWPILAVSALALHAPLEAQTSPAAITLAQTPSPAVAQPGVTVLTLVASGIPSGTIAPANLSVTLQVASGATGPALTAQVSAYSAIPLSGGRMTFQVLGPNVAAPTLYSVSVSGQTSTGITFASSKPAALTIDPPAQVLSLNPSSAQPGQTVRVSIMGQYTNYLQGSTAASFGSGVSVGGAALGQLGPVTVTSPTTAVAQLEIDPSAPSGPRAVTVATGIQQATLVAGFSVTAPPSLLSVSPNSGQQGQTGLSLTITGQFTHFSTGSVVTFGGSGITAGTPTGGTLTSLTVPISIAANAPLGVQGIQVVTGTETVSLANAFTVTAGAPGLISVTPNSGQQGQQNLSVTITGQYTHFLQSSSTISFGSDITITAVTATTPTTLKVSLAIPTGANLGSHNVTVTTGMEVVSLPAGFTVVALPTLVSITPNSGVQGTFTPHFFVSDSVGKIWTIDIAGHTSSLVGPTGFPTVTDLAVAADGTLFGTTETQLITLNRATGAGTLVGPHGPIPGIAVGLTFAPDGTLFATTQGNSGSLMTVNPTTGTATVVGAMGYSAIGDIAADAAGALFATVSPGLLVTVNRATGAASPIGSLNDNSVATLDFDPATGQLYGLDCNANLLLINPADASAITVGNVGTFCPYGGSFSHDYDAITVPITITGRGTHFSAATNIDLGPQVLVSNITVSDSTHLSAQLAIGPTAAIGPRDVTVSTGSEIISLHSAFQIIASPLISLVSPSIGTQGQLNVPVVISGNNTHFLNGSTTVSVGSGVGISGLTVISPTQLTATFSIPVGTQPGGTTITISTGNETVSLPNGFTVESAPPPTLLSLNPNSGQQGQPSLSLAITGQFTHFSTGSIVTFGGSGITAGSPTAATLTSLTVPVSIAANTPLGAQGIQVVTGTETVSLANAFTVTAGAPGLISVTPNTGLQGQQSLTVTINGQLTHFVQGTTQLSLGAGVTISSIVVTSTTNLTAQISIDPAAAVGTRTLTATTGSETAKLDNGFTVQALTCAPPPSGLVGWWPGEGNAHDLAGGHDGQLGSQVGFASGKVGQGFNFPSSSFGQPGSIVTVPEAPTLDLSHLTIEGWILINHIPSATADFVVATKGSGAGGCAPGSCENYGLYVRNISGAMELLFEYYDPSFVGSPRVIPHNGFAWIISNGSNLTLGAFHHVAVTADGSVVTFYVDGRFVSQEVQPGPLPPNQLPLQIGSAYPYSGNYFDGIIDELSIYNHAILGAEIETIYLAGNLGKCGGSPIPLSISPNTGPQGQQNLSVEVTALNTHFTQGTSQVSLGSDITINSVTVASATSLTANISIPSTASVGLHTLTVTTGTEVVSLVNAFAVAAAAALPSITSVSPNSGPQGQGGPIGIVGLNTHFAQGTTQVSFGSDITVNSITVTSATSLIVAISIPATANLGSHTVTVTTGSEIVALPQSFTVNAGTPAITTVTPNVAEQGSNGASITITGAFTHFSSSSIVTFGNSSILAASPTAATNSSITVPISIAATAALGPTSVTVSTGAEVVTFAAGFTVTALVQTVYLYSAEGGSNDIRAYQIDPGSGNLIPVAGSPFKAGTIADGISVDPSARFAYVANAGDNDLSAYNVNSSNGALTQVGVSYAVGSSPHGVTVDPTGRFVYVENYVSNNLSAFAINQQGGSLTPISGSPFQTAPGPQFNVAAHPSGRFLYVSNSNQISNGPGTVSGFFIDPTSGTLAPLFGSPYPTDAQPISVAIDPFGRFAYVGTGGRSGTHIDGFSIDPSTGVLAPLQGSPFSVVADCRSMTIDPGGRFLFVASEVADSVSAFSINPSSGALFPVPGSPFASNNGAAVALVVDPSSNFLYVGDDSISGFQINQNTGSLTPLAGSPFLAGVEPVFLATATVLSSNPPLLSSVFPVAGVQGGSLNVTIIGRSTHFSQGQTQVSFGSDIAVGSLTVLSATSLNVTLSIPITASVGAHTVSVTTGIELASLANAFTVVPSAPAITLVNPNSGQQGQTSESVNLTGQFTHWAQGTTTARFGAGITVATLTVNSATSATAILNIDPAAAIGSRNVTLTTGSEVASTGQTGFTVVGAPVITSSPPSGPAWINLTATGPVPAGRDVALSSPQIYDEENDRLIFFSGDYAGYSVDQIPADVWVLANASGASGTPTWIQLNPQGPGPIGRSSNSLTYIAKSNRLVVCGGSASPSSSTGLKDCWVLTNANGFGGTPSWIQLPDMPTSIGDFSAVYDPVSNRLIVFGGVDQGCTSLNTTIILVNADATGGTPSWITPTVRGALPGGREIHAAFYDTASNRMIVVGGLYRQNCAHTPALNDIWALNDANGVSGNPNWIQLTPAGNTPAGRYGHSLVYDSSRNEALLFGGFEGIANESTVSDLWLLTCANGVACAPQWQQLTPVGGPPLARALHAAGISSKTRLMPTTLGRYETGSFAVWPTDTWVLNRAAVAETVGQQFTYQVAASDPQNLPLSYFLTAAPIGMEINSTTGLLSFTPGPDELGTQSVTITVQNATGSSTSQSFDLLVVPAALSSAIISSVTPNIGQNGTTLDVTINGQNTHFLAGQTNVNFSNSLSGSSAILLPVQNVTVLNLTTLIARISIPADSAAGSVSITIATPFEVSTIANGFTVQASAPTPSIAAIVPYSGPQGGSGPVTITGQYTHFAQGATQVSFGPGITVSNVVVSCPTCLTAELQISPTAAVGPVAVTVTTGSEVATLAGGFTVLPGTPIISSFGPTIISQGAQNVTLMVNGQFTHWAQGTTQASLGAGVTVSSIAVTSATNLTAQISIDPAAAVGTRTLTVTTGSEVVSVANVFTVQAATPILYTLNPGGGTQGQQNLPVVITGLATHFAQGTSAASFGAGITVKSLTVASATSATAIVNIDPAAVPGARTATVTTGSEVASFTNGFTVGVSPPIVYTLDPGGSSQGATNLPVQITGLNTHFVQGTSVATFGAGITVNSLVVANATTATATINIDVAAALGPRTVTVTTGSEAASFTNGFTVVAGVPGITQINPGGGSQGIQNLPLAVTAQFTHFAQGTTTATIGGGVTVNSVTVTDSTHLSLSVSVSSAAATGPRAVTISTGTEVVSAPGGFVVSAGTPTLISVNPLGATQGQQNVNVTITGQFTHFLQGTSVVSFGGAGVTVNSVTVANATSLTASISLATTATTGGRTVTVTTGSEVATWPTPFPVQPLGNQPPVITIAPTWSVTLPNSLTLNYTVADPGLSQGGTLNEVWSTISGPGTVGFQNQTPTSIVANFSQAGSYTLQISATDSVTGLAATQNINVTVTGTLPPPPTVSITSPTEGTSVTTLTNVMGSVTSTALASWTLEFHMQNESFFRPIATGTTAVANGVLGVFDPTLLLNGFAIIQLRATDAFGQTSTFGPINVVVMGNQKVGNFTVSFNDLTAPVAGLPIQVVRTYDSRNKTSGDFGVGWRLDLTTVTLSANGALGDNWTGTNSGGLFSNYCISATTAHVVTVTFADGTVFQFQPALSPACQQLAPLEETSIGFTPISTTPPNASLAVVGSNQVAVDGSFPGAITLLDESEATSFNPDLYQLTMPDGRVLLISQASGLKSMTDRNGNKLTVSPNGITHSSGKSVLFSRDSAGRITKVTDPNGNVIEYGYDVNNNLASVQDAAGSISTFTYDANHGLLTIVDPAGAQPIKNVYDSSGRLIQHIDAFGRTINYTNNLAAQQEIITDRLDNVTANYYDANGNIVQVTDALGGNTFRTYDANNNLLTETNPLNEKRTYTYDANNNRLTEADPLGHTTTYTYNSRNQVLTIADALQRVTTNTYDSNGNLLSTKDGANNLTTYAYNGQGLRTSMTDALNNVTAYQYDSSGNLTQQTDALNHVTTYTYDSNGNKLSQTQTRTTTSGPQTLVTSYQYDADNRLTKTTYPDGSTTQIAYNAIGKQSITTDQLNRQTSYAYDLMGRLTQTTYPDQTTESRTYDAEGDRITSTDRGSRITSYAYDPLKRLYQTTYADNTMTGTTYDAAGEVTAVTDARGDKTQYQYDTAGRRTAVVDALSHTTGFTYDAVGNQTSITDANGHTSQYQYDADNRRTKVVYPDGTADSTAHDALGRTISKTDQAGRTTQYGYDNVGRLTQVTDALSQLTKYTYDEVGNRLMQTDANGHSTAFGYDNLGRRVLRTLPLGMSETSTYDLAGNLHSKTDFNGKTTSYGYDALNRLLTKTPDASLGQPTVHYTYSTTGQRLSMIDASGTTSYSYDLRDRLLQKVTPEGTLTYMYDAAGSLLSIRSSNTGGTSVNYAYDALNRLSTVTDNRLASGTTTYAYDNTGNLQSYLYPNGVQSLYVYDTLNRLTNLTLSKGGTIASYGYALGAAGNRTAVTEPAGRQVAYTYDALYRLTGETIAGGSVNGAIGYTYDPVGNRLTRTSTVGTVPAAASTYDANDRLSSDTYDANGSTIASGGNTYAYDFENHLASQNGGAVSIIYDGDGNRVSKTVGATTTKYVVDDRNLTGYAQVLEELIGGTVQRVYTYGLNRISEGQTSGTSFYGYDGHGSVRLLTDTTGAVTDRYDYDAFGNILSQTSSTPNVYLYSGEQNDSNLGLYYLRARYLSQSTGRFWTMDSYPGRLLDPVSLHKYLYTGNNPTNAIDPSGRQYSLVELSLAGALLGATVGADLYSVTHTKTFQWLQFAKATGTGLVAGAGLGTALYGGYYYLPAAILFFSQPLSSSLEEALEAAASDAGPTIRVFTNLTQLPQAGRALYAGIGPYAQEVAQSRVISGGQLYQADIPVALYNLLIQNIYLARLGTVLMEDFAGTEVYFAPAITKYIINFFVATQ